MVQEDPLSSQQQTSKDKDIVPDFPSNAAKVSELEWSWKPGNSSATQINGNTVTFHPSYR